MTSVLVTGGGGFIGTHWCSVLAERGDTGIVVDCNPQRAPLPSGWRYVRGDVRDQELLDELCASVDRVVHLAAAHHDAGIAPSTYSDVNVRGTACVLAAMDRHGVTDLVFTSTVAVYGDALGGTESTVPQPTSPYGKTKLEAEQLIERWAAQADNRSAVILRPAVVIGVGHFANMYSLMKQMDSGLFVHVGAGRNVKSLSSVRTVVGAGEWLRTHKTARVRALNIVSEPQLSSTQIINEIARAFKIRPPRLTIPLGVAVGTAGLVESTFKALGRSTNISPARVRKLFSAETRFEPAQLAATGFKSADTTVAALHEMASWFLSTGRTAVREQRLPPDHVAPRDRTPAAVGRGTTDPVPG